jgi:hypothetical protein
MLIFLVKHKAPTSGVSNLLATFERAGNRPILPSKLLAEVES